MHWRPTLLFLYSVCCNNPAYFCLSVSKHTYPQDDKVSMLIHTYKHKPLRKNKVTICNHQAGSPFYVWLDVWPGDLQVQKSMVIHDIECPHQDQVSLNNTNPDPLNILITWCLYGQLLKKTSRNHPRGCRRERENPSHLVWPLTENNWKTAPILAFKVLNFWKVIQKWSGWISDGYCRLKPVPRQPYIPHPLPLCCNYHV